MAKGLRYYIGFLERKRFLENAGVTKEDYFIASFPKSGNTWLRYLLAAAKFPSENITPGNIDKFLPSVYNQPFDLHALPPPRYIKTHEAYFSLYPKTIYICRDYRDVITSAFFYLQKKGKGKASMPEFVRSKELNAFGPWDWHVQTALAWKKKHPSRMHFLRYEDLLSQTEKSLASLLDFCNIQPGRALGSIIEEASFAQLQKKESQTENAGFFRKGISGDWKNHLSEKDEEILLSAGNTRGVMQMLGYL